MLSFDFSKAFDGVDLELKKLAKLPITPYVINWMISFLENRQQRVVVDGVYNICIKTVKFTSKVDSLQVWSAENRMPLNVKKTYEMVLLFYRIRFL